MHFNLISYITTQYYKWLQRHFKVFMPEEFETNKLLQIIYLKIYTLNCSMDLKIFPMLMLIQNFKGLFSFLFELLFRSWRLENLYQSKKHIWKYQTFLYYKYRKWEDLCQSKTLILHSYLDLLSVKSYFDLEKFFSITWRVVQCFHYFSLYKIDVRWYCIVNFRRCLVWNKSLGYTISSGLLPKCQNNLRSLMSTVDILLFKLRARTFFFLTRKLRFCSTEKVFN